MRHPASPPEIDDILGRATARRLTDILGRELDPAPDGKYLPWDRVRHLDPPDELTSEEWWTAIKVARRSTYRTIPLRDTAGAPFRYALPDEVLARTHQIDRKASGRIATNEQVTNPATRDRYIVSSLIEEATRSSQLEGAATTLRRAKEMIRSDRTPRNRSERMVLNNFAAMQFILEHTDGPLTPRFVLELHEIVTRDTLDDPRASGSLRHPGIETEPVLVVDARDGTVLHTPPDWSELPDRLQSMCDFANGEAEATFLHPVLRSIILHFWLAYDHPFLDGNGRTARALFYWSMVAQDYWLCQYISISRILRGAPARYARSFLHTESDENDLTYFILDQLDVVLRSIEALDTYLDRKTREIQEVEKLLRSSSDLNHRQLALLGHALRHPGARYTFESHRTSHDVVYQTARSDLLDLTERGLLVKRKVGRRNVFNPASDLTTRLQKESEE